MANGENGNGKIAIPKWALILMITAVIIPAVKAGVGFFFDTKDAQVEAVRTEHDKDMEWVKTEMVRQQKEVNDRLEKIDSRTIILLDITSRLDERTGGKK